MTHRRRIVIGSAAWLIAASARAATKHAKGTKGAGAKKVALVDDAAPDVVTYGLREDVVRFAEGVAERRELDVEWVKQALAQARFIPVVTRYIMPPTTGAAKNWNAYRARFVEPIRIRAGVAFWRANQRWLGQAEDLYGVPPEIVVGIVGVETIFGRQMGDFRLIDALATLAFDFPSGRKDSSAFFKDELEAWYVLCKSEGVDPLAWRGSYAGALASGRSEISTSQSMRTRSSECGPCTPKWVTLLSNESRVSWRSSGAGSIASSCQTTRCQGRRQGVRCASCHDCETGMRYE